MRALLLAVVVAAGACGGHTTVDGTSSGAGGGASSTGAAGNASTTASSATGAGPDCDALEKQYLALFYDALSCNPCIDADYCLLPDAPRIHDACACLVGANAMLKDVAMQAETAYRAWVSAGCGPHACGMDCPDPSGTFGCHPLKNSQCQGRCGAQ